MSEDDPIIQTRLDVAEMKGMLKQALSDHGQRLANLETARDQLHSRLSEKGKMLASHKERIEDLEESVARVHERADAQMPRAAQVITTLVATAGFVWAMFGPTVPL